MRRQRVALTGQEIASTKVTSPRGPFRAEQCGATIGKSSIMYPNSRGAAWYCKISDNDRSPSNSREIRRRSPVDYRNAVVYFASSSGTYITIMKKKRDKNSANRIYSFSMKQRMDFSKNIIYSICSETLVPTRDSCWYKYANN